MIQPFSFGTKVSDGSRERIDTPTHPLYPEYVYAGVLGKLIGVYLGRPVENWTYEKIAQEIGDVSYYIHDQRGRRLIITDDDISGFITFLRALEDYDYEPNLTPAQIGQTWLNYLIEETTILWWGGMGNSTEHTAYLRLKHGIKAPLSGSSQLNTSIVAEQIGAQIFIDGWGLICPGDACRAVDFAKRAASVSHDGEAIYGAQVIAALVAEAFVERDISTLIESSLHWIPTDSVVRKVIDDLRSWHATGEDWRTSREKLEAHYGYDKFKGQCHIVPNHGLIILSLLHGNGDFDESMKIVNTSGWDTDCNSGNVGAILGVRNGLSCFLNQDWRGPVADRLYLPTSDGGRSITDAANEAIEIVNAGRALASVPVIHPKDKARFHFTMPGSVQGWHVMEGEAEVRGTSEKFTVDEGSLLIRHQGESPARVATPTFIPPDTKDMVTGYVLVANPTLFSGHKVKTHLRSPSQTSGRLYIAHYNALDETDIIYGPSVDHLSQDGSLIEWDIPDTQGYPIHHIGIEVTSGELEILSMDWSHVPTTSWPPVEGTMWGRAWAKAMNRFQFARDRYEYMTHNEGIGLLSQGSRAWTDYRISSRITPRMAVSCGVAIRVQGLQRYYAFLFTEPGEVRLDKVLDGRKSLARVAYPWKWCGDYDVNVEVKGNRFRLFINGELILQAVDDEKLLSGGAFAFVVESGCMGAGTPSIEPL